MAIVYQRVSTPITNPDQGVDAMVFHIIWVLKSAAASLLWAGGVQDVARVVLRSAQWRPGGLGMTMTESHEAPIGDRVNSRNLIVGCGKYGCSTVVLHGCTIVPPIWGGRYSFHCLPHLFIPLFTSPTIGLYTCISNFFLPTLLSSVWMGEDKPTTYLESTETTMFAGTTCANFKFRVAPTSHATKCRFVTWSGSIHLIRMPTVYHCFHSEKKRPFWIHRGFSAAGRPPCCALRRTGKQCPVDWHGRRGGCWLH